MARRGLVVEVVGPAGAGKTTVARALAQHAPEFQFGLRLRRWWLLPRYAASALSTLPIVLERARGISGLTRQVWMRMVYLQVQLTAVQDYMIRHNNVLVLDQGPIFTLADLCHFGQDGCIGDEFQRWCNRMVQRWAGVIGSVIYLDATDDVLTQRIARREKSHAIKGAPAAEANMYLARYRAAVQNIIAQMNDIQGLMRLHFVTDQADVEPVVQQILTALDAQTKRAAPTVQSDEPRAQTGLVLGSHQGFTE